LDLSRATENREGREGNFLLAYSWAPSLLEGMGGGI
jgi:hypothetical protein